MKKFTETDTWKKSWFMGLSLGQKLAWKFLNDEADHAGVVDMSDAYLQAMVGDPELTMESLIEALGEDRVIRLRLPKTKDKFWLPGYIEYQHKGSISALKKPHQPAIRSIVKHRLPVQISRDKNGVYSVHNEWVASGCPDDQNALPRKPVLGKVYLSEGYQDKDKGTGTDKDKGTEEHSALFSESPPKPRTREQRLSAEFEILWELVPKKVGRGNALKAYLRARKAASAEDILEGVARFLSVEQTREAASPSDYRALHPTTWINREGWADEWADQPKPPPQLLQAAWTASGRNGSGPPAWEDLRRDTETCEDMAKSYEPMGWFLRGFKRCISETMNVQQAHGVSRNR